MQETRINGASLRKIETARAIIACPEDNGPHAVGAAALTLHAYGDPDDRRRAAIWLEDVGFARKAAPRRRALARFFRAQALGRGRFARIWRRLERPTLED